jgi:hypothetical protein
MARENAIRLTGGPFSTQCEGHWERRHDTLCIDRRCAASADSLHAGKTNRAEKPLCRGRGKPLWAEALCKRLVLFLTTATAATAITAGIRGDVHLML